MNVIIQCPHCKESIIIEALNCGIFRHGIHKQTLQQISPHAPKEECDRYVQDDSIYGCGKPFKITICDNQYIIEVCDYI